MKQAEMYHDFVTIWLEPYLGNSLLSNTGLWHRITFPISTSVLS